MATQGSYYVPEQSKLPLFASLGLFLIVFGAAGWIRGTGSGMTVFFLGALVFAAVLWTWFSTVIKENMAGMNSAQLKRSYVWGMSWFIFSEVMFFAAFFGALFYLRQLSVPWLAGEGDSAMTNELLWKGFENEWPLLTTPEQAREGEAAARFIGAEQPMGWKGLPLINTLILLTSSVTVHFAHTALKNANKKMFNIMLGLTVALGIIFLFLQVEEYVHAYQDLGLTLQTGVYGTTFFMLTGFHGAHVFLGTFMLLIMWLRSVLKGHFKHDDAFGFEAASWYWHFVDVVWVGLFLFVYVLGS
ncbi:cytochrome c oxidase subunit 3 [Gilvimarinus sp. F26214L]|uniref:cytochrome c oxidase subunit 3 n=1 Tax=Gilvimarinus sp. DZF01 TaxID=3461371 RepID=UPI004045ACEC